ncbi:MAG: hypothetical protein OEM38_00375 [Gammaproteobacteria bacterium]|nr:hypothetical protein [Gammaproteobacteria bacterium]
MITWLEKGHGLIEALGNVGITKTTEDGAVKIHPVEREAEAQVIIDTYDALPDYKKIKIEELKLEALSRVQIVYPSISNFDELKLVKDIIISIAPAARQLPADMTITTNIYQAGVDAVAAINLINVAADVQSYDVVNTPVWP